VLALPLEHWLCPQSGCGVGLRSRAALRAGQPWGPPADCQEPGLHAARQEAQCWCLSWRWRHSEVIQLFSASIYLAIDSI